MSIDVRRPNRSHGAIAQLPDDIRAWVNERLVGFPRWKYEQIVEHLAEEHGIDVTVQQVSRYFRSEGPTLERYARVRDMMSKLREQHADADVDSGVMDLAESLLMEVLVNVEPQDVKSVDDLMKVVTGLSRLKSSRVQVERLRLDMGKAVSKAFDKLTDHIRAAVGEGNPELLVSLLEMADKAASQLAEATGAK